MPKIELITNITAGIELCFDLSRSVDLHKISTAHTNEKAIAGKTQGLVEQGDWITWEAKHFGITQQLTSKITDYKRPFYFRDEQVKGAFKWFTHDHLFVKNGDVTVMKDVFEFEAPYGIAGKLFSGMILTNYMKKLLIKRNETIKEFAESEKWKLILNKKRR